MSFKTFTPCFTTLRPCSSPSMPIFKPLFKPPNMVFITLLFFSCFSAFYGGASPFNVFCSSPTYVVSSTGIILADLLLFYISFSSSSTSSYYFFISLFSFSVMFFVGLINFFVTFSLKLSSPAGYPGAIKSPREELFCCDMPISVLSNYEFLNMKFKFLPSTKSSSVSMSRLSFVIMSGCSLSPSTLKFEIWFFINY